jgi:hypothetical protein
MSCFKALETSSENSTKLIPRILAWIRRPLLEIARNDLFLPVERISAFGAGIVLSF